MATERQAPDVLITQTNLSGTVADIDEDPDSADGNWLTADSNNQDSVCIVSFPTPSGNPTTGAGLQEFRAWVRETANSSSCSWAIYLRDSGGRLNGGTAIGTGSTTSDTGEIINATWNASLISGTPNGSDVQCEVYITKVGGSPSNRTAGEVGAVEWNVDYTAGVTPKTGTDSVSVSVSESLSSDLTTSITDTTSVSITESLDSFLSTDISDPVTISISDTSAVLAALLDTDSIGLSVTESTELISALAVVDLVSVTISEGTNDLASTSDIVDTLDLSVAEVTSSFSELLATDAVTVSVADSSVLLVSIAVVDALSLGASEGTLDIVSFVATSDTLGITIEDIQSSFSELSATDTIIVIVGADGQDNVVGAGQTKKLRGSTLHRGLVMRMRL